MKTGIQSLLVAAAFVANVHVASGQSTAFTYQGHLLDNGTPFTGTAEVQFTLWDTASGGTQVAASSPPTVSVAASNGLFTTPVDFGAAAFNGSQRFLQVAVRTDAGAFGAIEPRQEVTAVPYAYLAAQLNGVRIQHNARGLPNVIAGRADNFVAANVAGAVVGGGADLFAGEGINQVTGDFGVVAGGGQNVSSGQFASAVGGGYGNVSSGSFATVPGGFFNTAAGGDSFAAGRHARAMNSGSFVWNSYNDPNLVIGENQFGVFAQHGLNVDYSTQRSDGGGSRFVYIGDNFAPFTITTWNGAALTDGGVWQNASDKNRKTQFAEIDPQSILEKLASLPLRTWRYTNETSEVKHLGPTGQDFKAAFGLGVDEKSIGTVDADGVALAAIKGLHQSMKEKEAQVSRLEARNSALAERLAELEKLVSSLAGKSETSSK